MRCVLFVIFLFFIREIKRIHHAFTVDAFFGLLAVGLWQCQPMSASFDRGGGKNKLDKSPMPERTPSNSSPNPALGRLSCNMFSPELTHWYPVDPYITME